MVFWGFWDLHEGRPFLHRWGIGLRGFHPQRDAWLAVEGLVKNWYLDLIPPPSQRNTIFFGGGFLPFQWTEAHILVLGARKVWSLCHKAHLWFNKADGWDSSVMAHRLKETQKISMYLKFLKSECCSVGRVLGCFLLWNRCFRDISLHCSISHDYDYDYDP